MHYSDMSGSDVQTVSERLGIQEQLLLDRIGEIDTDGVDQSLDQLSVLLQGYNDMARMRNSLAELIHSIGRRWDLPVENCHAAASEIMDPGTPDAELISLLREHIETAMYRIAQSRHQKPAGVIQLADTYMEEHYAEQISLEDIADHVKLSSFYFSRFYKKETGQNFTDRLAQIRIDHARELLRHEELSVKMVAYLVGYQEPNYFSRIFKRISGYTASDYKRMITEGEVRDL